MYKKLLTGFGAWSTSQTEVLCHFRSDILLFYFSQVIDGRFIGSGLLISMWEKLYLTRVIDKKMDGSDIEEKSSFKTVKLAFSSVLLKLFLKRLKP